MQIKYNNMELSGVMYEIYSNKAVSVVYEALKSYAASIKYQFEYYADEDGEDLFFFKDEQMRQHYEENAFNKDLNGEGCFNMEGKKTKIRGIAKLLETRSDGSFDPYDINLAFTEVYVYILTIPDDAEKDAFSRKIHEAVFDILTKE